jgi:hypothetical protein
MREENERTQRLVHQSATVIQKQWRMYKFRASMCLYRKSVRIIQRWFRLGLKQRVEFVRMRQLAVFMQRAFRARQQRRGQAAAKIQATWRMFAQRRNFTVAKRAVLVIQKWFRSKRLMIRYEKLKRSLPLIQASCRQVLAKRKLAVQLNAVIRLQRWIRDMRARFDYLKIRRNILLLQSLYRQRYLKRFHRAATRIQALWRGYAVRKRHTGQPMHRAIELIRGRLRSSIYVVGSSTSSANSNTLG